MGATIHAIWANCSPLIYVKAIKNVLKVKKSLALTAGNCVNSMTSSLS